MKSTKSDNFLNIFNCSEKFQKDRPLILSPWPVFCKLFCLITLQASANLPRQKKQKKLLKTMPDPWTKWCKSHVVFPRRIFRILVSIWGGFGVQKKSRNHPLGTKTLGSKPFWGVWNTTTVQNDVLESPKSIFEPTGVDLEWFELDLFKICRRFWTCFLTFSHNIFNFHFLADHCFSHFDFPDVKRLSKQSLKTEQSSFGYFLGGKVYRGLKLCQTSPFIVVLRSPIGLGGIAKRKQFVTTEVAKLSNKNCQ